MNTPDLVVQGAGCTNALSKMLEDVAKIFDAYADRIKAVEKAGVNSTGENELIAIVEVLDPQGTLYGKVKRLLVEYQKDLQKTASHRSGSGCQCGGASTSHADSEIFREAWDAMELIARMLRKMAEKKLSAGEIKRLKKYLTYWHPNSTVHKALKKALDEYESEYVRVCGKQDDATSGASSTGPSTPRLKP